MSQHEGSSTLGDWRENVNLSVNLLQLCNVGVVSILYPCSEMYQYQPVTDSVIPLPLGTSELSSGTLIKYLEIKTVHFLPTPQVNIFPLPTAHDWKYRKSSIT